MMRGLPVGTSTPGLDPRGITTPPIVQPQLEEPTPWVSGCLLGAGLFGFFALAVAAGMGLLTVQLFDRNPLRGAGQGFLWLGISCGVLMALGALAMFVEDRIPRRSRRNYDQAASVSNAPRRSGGEPATSMFSGEVERSSSTPTIKSPDRGLLPEPGTSPRSTRSLRGAWDYVPRGDVFVVDIYDFGSLASVTLEEFSTLDEAADRWAQIALPVQWNWRAQVIDSDLAVVLGYVNLDYRGSEEFPDGLWEGCSAGFESLGRTAMVNEVDLAIWESIAQRLD